MYGIMITTFKRIKGAPVTACFLLFGLIISMLMISIGTSFVSEIVNIQSDKMESAPPNALMFILNLNSEDIVSIKDTTNILGSLEKGTGAFMNSMLFNIDNAGVDNYFEVSAEWFRGDTGWHYPLSQGRYYTPEEVQRGSKVVLIGKQIKKYVQKINGQSFVQIYGDKYKVIGTVGFKDKKSLWDSRVFMPLASLPKLASSKYIESGNGSFVIYNSKKIHKMKSIIFF
ncbi:ABC transporter permease [Ruminiclostridium josui]|uniref:ABC transporter permease n=1 Tax=Ruminiclostridium josui TaxID=1499 RepID=UPI0006D28E60|nr:ABC transporter permease [Ruminiclostridium josui]